MRLRPLSTLTAVLVAALFTYACATDSPVAPVHATPRPPAGGSASSSLSSLLRSSAESVTPLERTTPLATPITTSKVIGILGGRLSIPQAGLTVIVPPLAVSSPTPFSVTALAGSDVAYEFSPHGIRFNVALVATQSLTNTQAAAGGLIDPLALFVGYFPNATDVTSVTELLNASIDLLGQSSTVTIWHFSGYMWASGRSLDE